MAGIDAVLVVSDEGVYDLQIGDDGDIVTSDSLDTAILVSLFTDARADASEVADSAKRRGWIGNESTPGIEMGSKLWLYDQARVTRETINGVRDATQDALQWLVDDGLAVSVRTAATASADGITVEVVIERPSGQVENRYYDLWNGTGV